VANAALAVDDYVHLGLHVNVRGDRVVVDVVFVEVLVADVRKGVDLDVRVRKRRMDLDVPFGFDLGVHAVRAPRAQQHRPHHQSRFQDHR